MEFEPSINQIMLPQVEPIAQLAPYLSGLNIADAVESFNKLADLVLLATPNETPSRGLQTTCCNLGPNNSKPTSPAGSSSSWSECLSPSWHSSPLSTSCDSATFGSQWLSSSSAASSPAPSDRTNSSLVRCSWSRGFSSSSSSSSCQQRDGSTGSGRRVRNGDRRKKNASAAEKYRRKLKGHECGLMEQVEREQQRNAKLRRDIEAKLALYREFAGLLAQNTGKNDLDLASLGSKSLKTVLASVCQQDDEETRPELQNCLVQFEQILASSAAPAPTTGAVVMKEDSDEGTCGLVYDFYTDSFVDS